jgi:hypothetical protein
MQYDDMYMKYKVFCTFFHNCYTVHTFFLLLTLFFLCTEFHWKRCLVRTGMMCVMVFVGESIPKFGKILSLVGGSTITLLTFVFPSFFYMRLCDQEKQHDWPERYFFLSICVMSPFAIEFWYPPTYLPT